MKMRRIAAAYAWQQPLGRDAEDLRPALRALTGTPLRRVNRYTQLSLWGALHCARAVDGVASDTALLLAAEAPMLVDSVRATRAVSADAPPTPYDFMNVSGNMAGFHIAQLLGMRGPQLTVSRLGASLHAAVDLLMLDAGAWRRALLGVVQEGLWPAHEMRARYGLPEEAALSESSHWLYVDESCSAPLGGIATQGPLPDMDALRASLAALPADWPVRLYGAEPDDPARLDAAGRAPARDATPPGLASGAAACAAVAFLRDPDAPGRVIVSRGGDGLWYPLLLRAGRPD